LKGFLTESGYGLIPFANQWMVINGKGQLKVFWSYESGVEYIDKLNNKSITLKTRKQANKKILNCQ
jgi:hypothetical protein